MVNTGGLFVISVESVVPAPADPPPETETEFTCGDDALGATFTVTVIGGYLPLAFNASLLVQVFPGHVHPVPAMDTSVKPAGTEEAFEDMHPLIDVHRNHGAGHSQCRLALAREAQAMDAISVP